MKFIQNVGGLAASSDRVRFGAVDEDRLLGRKTVLTRK